MKIKSIEVFLATVQSGSIRAAARQLELSQPAVSKAIKALEEEVGAPLLTRGTKGVYLTEFGKAFLIRATTISQESAKAIEEIKQMRGEVNGSVSIMLSPVTAMLLAPLVIKQFLHTHPAVKIHIFEGLQASAVEKLRTVEIDFAIAAVTKPHLLSNKEFEVHPIKEYPMAIVGRRDNPFKNRNSLVELHSAKWVQIGSGGHLTTLINDFYETKNLTPPNINIECHSFTSSLAMIENTDMLGMMPEIWLNDPSYSSRFCKIDVKEGMAVNKLQLIFRRDKPLTPVANQLLNHFLRRADV
ncbi:LysR substrate-binding domain-containing protein [Marinomonas algicola]|uniref:LysR substrate-binding domain-containing protein n=1 Tax=Marinomonas algicola TaxID=2773454 RepID=UPI00174CE106|nr:LysR substrate-binding domain-containing protein [Marinomonas algicola]